jgi:acetyl/propionyl-CoA carboxylase alpha subunit
MSDRNYTPAGGSSFEIRRQADGSLEVKKAGDKASSSVKIGRESSAIDNETSRLHCSAGNSRKLFWVYARGNKRVLSWPGGSMELDSSDLTEGGAAGEGSLKPLKLIMPGKVLAVKVKEGDVVEPGQGLVIVEAMKMENLMLSAAKAIVAKVHIKEGDRLESGAVLITFKPLDA